MFRQASYWILAGYAGTGAVDAGFLLNDSTWFLFMICPYPDKGNKGNKGNKTIKDARVALLIILVTLVALVTFV